MSLKAPSCLYHLDALGFVTREMGIFLGSPSGLLKGPAEMSNVEAFCKTVALSWSWRGEERDRSLNHESFPVSGKCLYSTQLTLTDHRQNTSIIVPFYR